MPTVQVVSVFAEVIYFVIAKSLKLIVSTWKLYVLKAHLGNDSFNLLEIIWLQIKGNKVIFVVLFLSGQKKIATREEN